MAFLLVYSWMHPWQKHGSKMQFLAPASGAILVRMNTCARYLEIAAQPIV